MMEQFCPPSDDDLARIRKSLSYNSQTGVITRIQSWHRRFSGKEIVRQNDQGYVVLKIRRRMFNAHRIAWYLHYDVWPVLGIDHINGVRSDNRICNLRLATVAQNRWNSKKPTVGRSRFKGVSPTYDRKKWQANIYFGGKKYYLGTFDLEIEAAEAYGSKAQEFFGEFRRSG